MVVAAALRRQAVIWRWAGVGAGVLGAGTAALTGALGRGLLLTAPLFGVCVLAGVLAGELSVPRPAGRTRHAAIAVRRAGNYVPRALTCAVGVATAVMAALLSMSTVLGSADSLGRAGRVLTRRCNATVTQSHGPWIGSYYSVPLAILVVAGLVAAGFAARQIVIRPRSADPDALAEADDVLRSLAARTITGASGVLVTIPLLAATLVTADGLLAISCRPAWWSIAAWLLLALMPAWLVVLAWSALAVFAPQRLYAAHPATVSGP